MNYSNEELVRFYSKAISLELDKLIETKQHFFDKSLKEKKDSFGFFGKSKVQMDINKYEKDISSINKAKKYVWSIQNTRSISMNDTCIKAIIDMMPYLEEKEQKELQKLVNDSLKEANKRQFSNIKNNKKLIVSSIKSINPNARVEVHNDNDDWITNVSMEEAMNRLIELKESEKNISLFNGDEAQYKEDIPLIEQINTILSSGKTNSPTYKYVSKNKDNIIELSKKIVMLEKQKSMISTCRNLLKSYDGDKSEYRDVIDYVSSLVDKRIKDSMDCRKSLNKYDLDSISNMVNNITEENKKKQEKEDKVNNTEMELSNLYFKLAELNQQHADITEIAAIEDRIRELEEIASNNVDIDVSKAKEEAKSRLADKMVEQEMRDEEDKASQRLIGLMIVADEALEAEALNVYREKHRKNWNFEDLDKGPAREEIEQIKSGLRYNALLSPEERCFNDLKKAGAIHETATLETLTNEERITLNKNVRFYDDSKYSYVTQYKEYYEASMPSQGRDETHHK